MSFFKVWSRWRERDKTKKNDQQRKIFVYAFEFGTSSFFNSHNFYSETFCFWAEYVIISG